MNRADHFADQGDAPDPRECTCGRPWDCICDATPEPVQPFTVAEFRDRIAAILKPFEPAPKPKLGVRAPTDRGFYPPKRKEVK